MSLLKSAASMFLLAFIVPGQTGPNIVATGYTNPIDLTFAPNQMANIFVSGVSAPPQLLTQAAGFPLPTTLAGFSVSFREYSNVDPVQLPIFAVRKITDSMAAITIQIPKVTPDIPYAGSEANLQRELIVSEKGVPGPTLHWAPVWDKIHIWAGCDPVRTSQPTVYGLCYWWVDHVDGRAVLFTQNPVHVGDALVVYATGLGLVGNNFVLGQASP